MPAAPPKGVSVYYIHIQREREESIHTEKRRRRRRWWWRREFIKISRGKRVFIHHIQRDSDY